MRKLGLVLGTTLLLMLLATLATAKCTKVEVYWDSENAVVSIVAHRYRPSSTSGWATEELATLDHEAGHSLGCVTAWIDHSCNIEGIITAKDGSLDVASIIHQDYGKWFRGVRIAEASVESPEFDAVFSAHTFTMKTHLDNTWTLDAWLTAEGSDMSVYATRLYQHFKTHGTPDDGDDEMDSQYYALIDAVLGDGEAFAGSGWFPDANSVWRGDEVLAFQLTGDDISAYIESVDFPIIDIYVDVDELIGEVARPR